MIKPTKLSKHASERAVKRAQARQQQTANGNRYFFRDQASDEVAKLLTANGGNSVEIAQVLVIGDTKQTRHTTETKSEKEPSDMTGSAPSAENAFTHGSAPTKSNRFRLIKLIWFLLSGVMKLSMKYIVSGLSCMFSCTTNCMSGCFYQISRGLKLLWLLLKVLVKFPLQHMIRALKWIDSKITLDIDEIS